MSARVFDRPVVRQPDPVVRPVDGSDGRFYQTFQKRQLGWTTNFEFWLYGPDVHSPLGGAFHAGCGWWRPTRRLAERAIARKIARRAGYPSALSLRTRLKRKPSCERVLACPS